METLPKDDHNQDIFFHKLGHFFPIFEKGQGRPPPPPPSSYASEDSNFNGAGPHQGDLLKKFKENNLAEVNCLKLQIQEKPSQMFSLVYNLPKTMPDVKTMSNLCPSKLQRKK